MSKNGVINDRTKHISVKEQMAIENIENGNLEIEWTPTNQMKADGFTKALKSNAHSNFISQLGINRKIV